MAAQVSQTHLPVDEDAFQMLFETHPVPMWIYDLKTLAFLEVNEAARETYGYSRQEFLEMTLREIRPAEDLKRLETDVKRKRPALQHSGNWRHRLKNGTLIDVEINSHTISYQGRKAVLVEARDVTEKLLAEKQLKDLNRILVMVNHIGSALQKQPDQEKLLNEICRIAVKTGGFHMAWVGLFDPISRRVKPVSSAGHVDSYLDDLNIVLDDSPQGSGPTAIALKSGQSAVVQDIATDERMLPWRRPALSRGYRASAAFPLSTESGLAGTFNLYSSEIGFFTPQITTAIQNISLEFAFAIQLSRQEQKQQLTRAVLRDSETRFRTMFEQAAVGVALVDSPTGRFLNVNRKMCDLTGYSEAELLARTFKDITHPDDLPRNMDYVRRFLAGEISQYAFEKRYLRKDGSTLWVFTNIAALWAPEDKPTNHILVVEDISDLKKVETALRQAEEKYHSIYENAPVGIFQSSPQGNFLNVNSYMAHMYGFGTIDAMVSNISDISRQIYADPDHRQEFVNLLKKKGLVERFETRELKQDGSLFWTSTNARVVRNAQGDLQYYEGFVTDITERKQVELELQRNRELLENGQVISGTGSWEDDFNKGSSMWSANLYRIFDIDPKTTFTPGSREFHEKFVHPEDRQRVSNTYVRALAGESDFDIEYRIIRRDGSIGKVHSIAIIQRHADGRPLLLTGWTQDITSRWLEETSRRETEVRYRTLVEQIPAIVYTDSAENADHTLYISPQLKTLLDYDPQEWMADDGLWFRIMHPDDRQRVQAEFDGTNASGKPFSIEYRLIARDGHVVWFRDESILVCDQTGKSLYWHGIMLDITERKQAEKELRDSEGRYRDLVENSRELICTHDLEGNLLSVNPAGANMLGYGVDEILHMNIRDFLVPEAKGLFESYIEEIRQSGKAAGMMLIQTRSGERRLWEYYNTLRTEGVVDPLVRGMAHDITERKRAEQALQESEARFRRAIEAAGAVPYLHDYSTNTYTFIGEGILALTGYTAREMTPALFGSLEIESHLLGESVNLSVKAASELMHAGKLSNWNCDSLLVARDGTNRWVSDTSVPVLNETGQVKGSIGYLQDITERKQAEIKIQKQMDELRQWYQVTLRREQRIGELKREVNELLQRLGEPPHYSNPAVDSQNRPTLPSQ